MDWGAKGFAALFTFVLAAILGPRDFGTVSMAMIYVVFIQLLLNQGLFAAIIQRPDLQPEHLDSVFWLGQASGLILVGFSVGLSRWWAATWIRRSYPPRPWPISWSLPPAPSCSPPAWTPT